MSSAHCAEMKVLQLSMPTVGGLALLGSTIFSLHRISEFIAPYLFLPAIAAQLKPSSISLVEVSIIVIGLAQPGPGVPS